NLDLNRSFRAGPDASWLTAFGQSVVAHIAFADHSTFGIVLRYSIGTVPSAVPAADTGLRIVNHDTCDEIFRVCVDRTAAQPDRKTHFDFDARFLRHVGSRQWLQPIDKWSRCVLGYHPPSISPTRRQLICAGFPFCSLQATTQHLQPMHLVISKWKRYCSPGAGCRPGILRANSLGTAQCVAFAEPAGLREVIANLILRSFAHPNKGNCIDPSPCLLAAP